MSYRFITIKDPHLLYGFDKPSVRKGTNDDFISNLDAKWDFVRKYCRENKIKDIYFTGDLFEEQKGEKWKLPTLNEMEKKFFIPMRDAKLNLYTIYGNHDYFNGNYQDKNSTALGYFERLGYIKTFDKDEVIEKENVRIYGIGYLRDNNELINQLTILNDSLDTQKINVCFLHENFAPNEDKIKGVYGYSALVPFTNVDIFVLGHYHNGFAPTLQGKTHIINDWNYFRMSREYSVRNDEHIPSFSDINVDAQGNIEIKTVIYKDFIPYEEAFNAVEINSKKLTSNSYSSIEAFNELGEASENKEKLNELDVLEIVAKDRGYNERIVTLAKTYLGY
jgi:calcineurin-like phosphoesterase